MAPRDIGLAILICIAWAFNFLTSATALRETTPFLFTALRFALLGLCLLPMMRVPPREQWGRLIVCGLLVGVAHFGLSFWSLREAGDLSSPAVVMQSYIPMTAVLAWVLIGERFGLKTGVAILTSFIGIVVLAFDPMVVDHPKALILMLLSALALALATVFMKGLKGFTVFNQQGWFAWVALFPLLLISVVFEPGAISQLPNATWRVWQGVVYAALVASLLGHGLYFQLLQRNPIAQITPWLLLTPIMGIAIGIAFWGDRPGIRLYIGAALVLAGVLMIAIRQLHKSRTTVPDVVDLV
ncbi:DMT family transporter [Luteimonas sp. FXH3W]|uniref:DMT family transporter n=1 Tax=Aquilutibacter rugosus TaxID=3115820 RepID=A0ABU7UWH0_9GAMM